MKCVGINATYRLITVSTKCDQNSKLTRKTYREYQWSKSVFNVIQTTPNGNGKEIDLKHLIEDTHPSRKGIIFSYTLFVIYQEQPLVFVVIYGLCKIFTLHISI